MASLAFPTPLHQQAALAAQAFFSHLPETDTVLVVNSCARGVAVPESDLDMAILVRNGVSPETIQALEREWLTFRTSDPAVQAYLGSHAFAQLHLDVIDGVFAPTDWDDGGGPDYYEVEIGNRLVYSAPMGEAGAHFRRLQAQYLPFYDESLRQQRLAMALHACHYDLDHIPMFVSRGLHFQAFDRLYKAYQEFLQALFISRSTYPIAYNKWIREQVERWLSLPELYPLLGQVLSVSVLESEELVRKAAMLRALVGRFIGPR